jgi:DHA1 family multidrug resistance protein-like MFS transporter
MSATIATSDLTLVQRRRGITALMISTFFSWAGFFLVIPLVAVHYVDDLGWAAGTVGIVLAVRQLTQQSLTTVFGVVSDRVGPKPLITVGMLIRVLGFVSMAWADSFVTVLGSLILAGIGGSMFESPKSAAFAALAAPEERQRLFSKVGVVSGIGTTVGTQLGALLIPYDFSIVCLVGAAAYVVIFVQMMILLPPIRVSTGSHSPAAGLGLVMRDTRFMVFLLILTGYFFCTTQFGLTITLAATRITGTDAAVSWIYAVNAVATIGLGYILPRILERWMSSLMLLISGTLILGGGLALVGFAGSTLTILIAAAVFSLGAILARPGQETVIANLADPVARGTYFGVSALSLAVGGSLGNYLGGVIYSQGSDGGNAAGPWLVFAGVAVVTSISLIVYQARYRVPGSSEPQPAGGATGVPEASTLTSAPVPKRSSSKTMI